MPVCVYSVLLYFLFFFRNMAENNPFPQGQPNVGYQQPQQPQQPNPYQGYPQGQPQPQQAQQQPQQNQSGRRVYSY